MGSLASNHRAVSATFLLTLIATGLCLAMASAVPVANARRLQQQPSPGLRNPLQELTATLSQLQGLLQALPKNVEDKLQNAATSVVTVAQVQGLLQTITARLQSLPDQEQAQLQTPHDLQDPLNEVLRQLQSVTGDLLQNLTASLMARLDSHTMMALLNLLNNLQGQLQLGAPSGLQNQPSNNGQNVFGLVPGIQGSVGAQQKP